MKLFGAEWVAEFGEPRPVDTWTSVEQEQHFRDLEHEVTNLTVPVGALVVEGAKLPHPDRRMRLASRNARLLALIDVKRKSQRRQEMQDRRAQAFLWMHDRNWQPGDICARLHITHAEYEHLLYEARRQEAS